MKKFKQTLMLFAAIVALAFCTTATYAQGKNDNLYPYAQYLTPNPFIDGRVCINKDFEIYASKTKPVVYTILFHWGVMNYSAHVTFIGKDADRFIYREMSPRGDILAVVETYTPLSKFMNNWGQMQTDFFDKKYQIDIHISGMGSLTVCTLHNSQLQEKTAFQAVLQRDCGEVGD